MSDVFRSQQMRESYASHKQSGILERECVLCTCAPITEFTFWKIIPNNFPYDLIAQQHQMLVPKRHVTEAELTPEELQEMITIKSKNLMEYDYMIEAVTHKKSIPSHFHIHLIIGKPIGAN